MTTNRLELAKSGGGITGAITGSATAAKPLGSETSWLMGGQGGLIG
jgi:hypothetical protein